MAGMWPNSSYHCLWKVNLIKTIALLKKKKERGRKKGRKEKKIFSLPFIPNLPFCYCQEMKAGNLGSKK